MFGVRSIPFCVMFKGGQPVDGFVGAHPGRARSASSSTSTCRARTRPRPPRSRKPPPQEALAEGDTQGALEKLQHAVATDPANDDARFDYVKLLLQEGRIDDAKVAFAPVIAKTLAGAPLRFAPALDGRHRFRAPATGTAPRRWPSSTRRIAANKRDFDARFDRARLLMAAQRWTDAMDELLDILMRDKTWNEDLARKTYIAILDIIEPPKAKVADGQIPPDDPTVASYRRRLSSVVLS